MYHCCNYTIADFLHGQWRPMNVNLANSSFCFWVWLHATCFMLKGVEYFRRIFIAQDHTLQDHFCSMIDEFPVWSSETDQAAMMWIVPYSEREEATEHNAVLCRWSPDLDKEPSERCNITSPCLPQQVTCLNQMYKLYSWQLNWWVKQLENHLCSYSAERHSHIV